MSKTEYKGYVFATKVTRQRRAWFVRLRLIGFSTTWAAFYAMRCRAPYENFDPEERIETFEERAQEGMRLGRDRECFLVPDWLVAKFDE